MISPDQDKLKALLLGPQVFASDDLITILTPIGFSDAPAAVDCLRRLAATKEQALLLQPLLPTLMHELGEGAHPDRALVSFERFVHAHHSPAELYRILAAEPRTLEVLILLFAGSEYLTEILLRHPQGFEQLSDRLRLTQSKNQLQFYKEAMDAAEAASSYEEKLNRLRSFQKGELLRLGASDLFGLSGFLFITSQLSQLANGLIQAALDIVTAELGLKSGGLAVLALGKLGGRELNYSSDIDLLFLTGTGDERQQRVGQKLIDALNRPTEEGFLYRVDMRLRPWGNEGKLAPGRAEHLTYLKNHARPWEKQALLKCRFVAGDELISLEFLQDIKPLVFGQPRDQVRKTIRAMKGEIEKQLKRKGREWGEVKSGKGSIRDVEFVTQYLQLVHGALHPEVRSRNTLDGLARLVAAGLLSGTDYRVLADGYTFLRTVEHHLQIMHNQQTHRLPQDRRELTFLARRMGFEGNQVGELLIERYHQHSAAIRAVYQRLVEDPPEDAAVPLFPAQTTPISSGYQALLSQMDASYTALFGDDQIQRHVEMAERLSDRNLVEVEAIAMEQQKWRLTIVGYDYVGELSLICGLLFVHGLNIEDGQIFSYEPPADLSRAEKRANHLSFQRRRVLARRLSPLQTRRRIVDVLTVTSPSGGVAPDLWSNYSRELSALVGELQAKQHREVQGKLAKRVAMAMSGIGAGTETLLPVEIDIDNTASSDYTVIRIDAPDTIGFLYELFNTLALNGINISRVAVTTIGQRVHDTLFVTDLHDKKITDPEKQQQLRTATVLVKHFTHLLPSMPNPGSALLHFHEFLAQLFDRPEWTREIARIERPEVLESLARLLGVSDFLWEDFLRMQHANLFPVLENLQSLAVAKTKAQLRNELHARLQSLREISVGASELQCKREVLNAFKDREMFRIDMRFIQRLLPEFWLFSAELTHLGEVVMEAAYDLSLQHLLQQHGEPRLENGQACAMCLCALGKFGGREIGFASDLELMFLYRGAGMTAGPHVIANSEFLVKLVHEVSRTIKTQRESIFEIDLRLRPYGKAGSLGVTLEAFQRYFSRGGAAWNYERQALVKLRPLAGDLELGRRIVALRDACVYTGEPFDAGAMRALRERQVRQLVKGGTINAKFSPGALVEVEYLIEGLQITHGHEYPELRTTNTSDALIGLMRTGIISTQDYVKLREALDFLRRLIQGLRVVRGHAKDLTVPAAGSDEMLYLARRMGYEPAHQRLLDEMNGHTATVLELSRRLLG
ncbi:MAG: ACT domain-containing protein [bacterium]